MFGLQLTAEQRRALRCVARDGGDARQVRRALALLDLARGEPVAAVARRYQVCRDTIYQWAARLLRPGPCLGDAPRAGRPGDRGEAAERLIRAALRREPLGLGYRHPAWTAGLLRQHLWRAHGLAVSVSTVRRAVRRLGFRWKRPRFVLARRDPHWRQAKGGCSAG
jgi:transposase